MEIKLENESLLCHIDTVGAQLLSLVCKKNGKDYIWSGDPAVWKWHAPVLFPCCGNFPEGYTYEGKTYHLPQHGFLRDVEHLYDGNNGFLFHSDGREDYPFPLETKTEFLLKGKTLVHRLTVKNTGTVPMPYSMGFHTGFALSNAVLEFEMEEEELGSDMLAPEEEELGKVMLFTSIQSRTIHCMGEQGKRIRFSSPDFTTLVLWSMPGHAKDYICIEPRFDTIREGAKEPFKLMLEPGQEAVLEEEIEILG